jgi:hydrogenase expression/formation protein HypC
MEGKMCLGIPMKIVEVKGGKGVAEIGGIQREIGLTLTPEVKAGDYVIVHAGFAIGILDETEAKKTLKLIQEVDKLLD